MRIGLSRCEVGCAFCGWSRRDGGRKVSCGGLLESGSLRSFLGEPGHAFSIGHRWGEKVLGFLCAAKEATAGQRKKRRDLHRGYEEEKARRARHAVPLRANGNARRRKFKSGRGRIRAGRF